MHRMIVLLTVLSSFFSWVAPAGAQTITMDLQQTDQQVLGFGGQIWAGNTVGRSVMVELGARYARVQHGSNFFTYATQPPTDSNSAAGDNFTSMKSYIAANFNTGSWPLPNIKSTQSWANANDIELLINEFQIAHSFLDSSNTYLLTSCVDDYATFWAALLSYLDDNGVRPGYIELANEPNGTWNGWISNTNYNTLVKQTRELLDTHGFSDVGIVGPGLSVLGNPSWVNALDANAANSLAGWSTHAWDDTSGIDNQAQIFESAVDAKDPNKPIFITEYATKITEFNGTSYGVPEEGGDAADQSVFAVQVFKNTLSLVNHGAGALILWEAADQSWSSKRWGLKRLDGTDRPTLPAMKTLTDVLPNDATALEQIWDDPEITAAGFIKDGKLIVGLANTLDSNESRTLGFSNVPGILRFDEGMQFNDGVASPVTCTVADDSVSLLMLAESTQTLVFDILPLVPGDFDRSGTVDQDDLVLWQAGYGTASGAEVGDGDADEDGDVDCYDLLLWQQNFGSSSSIQSATQAVPEPNAAWLMTCTMLVCAGRGCRLPWSR